MFGSAEIPGAAFVGASKFIEKIVGLEPCGTRAEIVRLERTGLLDETLSFLKLRETLDVSTARREMARNAAQIAATGEKKNTQQ